MGVVVAVANIAFLPGTDRATFGSPPFKAGGTPVGTCLRGAGTGDLLGGVGALHNQLVNYFRSGTFETYGTLAITVFSGSRRTTLLVDTPVCPAGRTPVRALGIRSRTRYLLGVVLARAHSVDFGRVGRTTAILFRRISPSGSSAFIGTARGSSGAGDLFGDVVTHASVSGGIGFRAGRTALT